VATSSSLALGLGLAGAHRLLGLGRLGVLGLALGARPVGVRRRAVGVGLGLADHLLHDRGHEGRHLERLVVLGAAGAGGRGGLLLGRVALARAAVLGRRVIGALGQPAAGVGQPVVDQLVEPGGQLGRARDARALALDVGEQPDRAADHRAGAGRDAVQVRAHAERVLQQRLDHRLGVAEVGDGRPALGAGDLDQAHVLDDARIGAPDQGVDPVALDDVEEVAGERRLGEERVEARQVGLGVAKCAHGRG
jgi:hypothetical protein